MTGRCVRIAEMATVKDRDWCAGKYITAKRPTQGTIKWGGRESQAVSSPRQSSPFMASAFLKTREKSADGAMAAEGSVAEVGSMRPVRGLRGRTGINPSRIIRKREGWG